MNLADDALDLRLDLVHQLHRLEDAQSRPWCDRVALLDEGRGARRRSAVERADHRALDPDVPVVARHDGGRLAFGGRSRRSGNEGLLLRGPAHADARPVLLDRDLADPGLLDDPHDLTDALCTRAVDTTRAERLITAGALANRLEQRLGLLAEQCEQQQLLLRGRKASGLFPELVEVDHFRRVVTALEQLDRPLERRID